MIKLRKQIYLDKTDAAALEVEGQRRHQSVSFLIRHAIRQYLQGQKSHPDWQDDPVAKLIGRIHSQIKDGSVHHDKYLYE